MEKKLHSEYARSVTSEFKQQLKLSVCEACMSMLELSLVEIKKTLWKQYGKRNFW
jgi:hypothetical protein